MVRDIHYRLDVNTLHRDESATSLGLNDVGRVSLRVTQPLFYDSYRRNRQTGSFILAAEDNNVTVGRRHAARPRLSAAMPAMTSSNVTWHEGRSLRDERSEILGSRGATLWVTGLSGSGKSTLASAVEKRLVHEGRGAYLLDGDNLRTGLNSDLGFTREARQENARRTAEVARLFADAGLVAIVALISPYAESRRGPASSTTGPGCPSPRSTWRRRSTCAPPGTPRASTPG